jgi:hypothetical protein
MSHGGRDPNSRILKLTTVIDSDKRSETLPTRTLFRYDAAAYLNNPEGENRNEFLRSLFTRGPAHHFESPDFAVGPGYAQTNRQNSARHDLGASNN